MALVSTKRSMSHEKLPFIVRTMWATSVEGEWFFQWLHLRHSGQRAPIQFHIDVNFEEFQFCVLATIAGLATSHCVDDVLGVDRKQQFSRVGLFGVS